MFALSDEDGPQEHCTALCLDTRQLERDRLGAGSEGLWRPVVTQGVKRSEASQKAGQQAAEGRALSLRGSVS